MVYTPQPIDVSDIELNKSLKDLIEKLAKNTHDIWATQRYADGWSFGKERHNSQKYHPCLVNYEDLPEEEKEYDRKVSEGIIKTVLKMGYTIHPLEKQDNNITESLEEEARALQREVLNTTQLFTYWKSHNPSTWAGRPELYCLLGEKTLRAGEALLAYDILSKGLELLNETVMLENHSDPSRILFVKMQQQCALALAQSGAAEEAGKRLLRLVNQGADDSETYGILGRTFKDLAFLEINSGHRTEKFREAFSIYHKAHLAALEKKDIEQAYYNGINSATMALFAGDLQTSNSLARTVENLCRTKLKTLEVAEVSHWLYATLGEAHLLTANLDEARIWYNHAAQKAQGEIRDIASMRKQVRVILLETGAEMAQLDDCFQVPTVVAFTGHMIDRLNHPMKRFPADMEEHVRSAISRELEEINAGIAYASAACGSDIIFLEEMIKRGGEINIILPFEKERFIEESVNVITGGGWLKRFEYVLERAVKIHVLGVHNELSSNQTNFEFANLFLYGSAVARSQTLNTSIYALAVWDGQTEGLPGGTASTVHHWQSMPHTFISINPFPLHGDKSQKQITPTIHVSKEPLQEKVRHHTYLPMLFADVKGFSKLTEHQMVNFSDYFLGHVGKIINRFKSRILSKSTQGDGLFLVFKDIATAVQLAIALQKKTNETDWSRYGLPAELLFRISLDAGPTYSFTDPIIDRVSFLGAYVIRAARMEPITPPGHIYASETFVALAHATGLDGVRFDYAGQVVLPKDYGVVSVSHVRQSRENKPQCRKDCSLKMSRNV